ncbi:hypothetical protein pXoo2106_04 [Xanthomonas phage pXoo2106]|uniref:Integrase n=1 Tax=Xanthomonas phage pXoo2106 TaxID=2970483 RepID=A0AAX3C0Q4_9CAUD|nr:hypothetical protein pXoo2106_04 [Xanthomonas phage pXoo2106]
METIKMQLGVTAREASLLRSALHIACALTAKARPLDNQGLADEFSALHAEFRDNDVELFEDRAIIEFEESVLDAVRHAVNALTVPYGGRGMQPDLFSRPLTVGYGMRELDFAAIEARVLACLLNPTPPIVLDASQLPFEFKGTVTGRTVLPGAAMPDNVPRKLPDVLMDDQSARHVALTASQTGLVNKAEPKGWIVQFNLRHGSIALANWAQVRELGLPQRSRNAAYRMLKARAKAQGIAEDAYRVVPAGTPDGPEKDRGFYTAEFFTKHALRQHQLGWHTSSVRGLHGTFPTAQAARNAIDQHVKDSGATASRYRVKWHKNVA